MTDFLVRLTQHLKCIFGAKELRLVWGILRPNGGTLSLDHRPTTTGWGNSVMLITQWKYWDSVDSFSIGNCKTAFWQQLVSPGPQNGLGQFFPALGLSSTTFQPTLATNITKISLPEIGFYYGFPEVRDHLFGKHEKPRIVWEYVSYRRKCWKFDLKLGIFWRVISLIGMFLC